VRQYPVHKIKSKPSFGSLKVYIAIKHVLESTKIIKAPSLLTLLVILVPNVKWTLSMVICPFFVMLDAYVSLPHWRRTKMNVMSLTSFGKKQTRSCLHLPPYSPFHLPPYSPSQYIPRETKIMIFVNQKIWSTQEFFPVAGIL